MPIFIIYTVKPGDTLGDIALRYDTTVEALAKLNGIRDTDRLTVGQRLRIPHPACGRPPQRPPQRVYVVQTGDTLWGIARANNTDVQTLARLNGLRNPDLIYPGRELRLPD